MALSFAASAILSSSSSAQIATPKPRVYTPSHSTLATTTALLHTCCPLWCSRSVASSASSRWAGGAAARRDECSRRLPRL
ncbi:hypothetical protein B0J12DRAFT_670556, partial [Macrophomina phaseolina]